jgi:hypothetical protein
MKKIILALLIAFLLATMAVATPKMPRPGSYIIVNALDDATGEKIENYTIKVSMEFPGDYSSLNYNYEQTYYRENKIGISMPPPEYGAVAIITLTSDGYSDSNKETLASDYYWNNLGKDYVMEYNFKLKKESSGFCCFSMLPLALAMLSAVLTKIYTALP